MAAKGPAGGAEGGAPGGRGRGGGRGGGGGGRGRAPKESRDGPLMTADGVRLLKVSAESVPRKVAGAIAILSREDAPPHVSAIRARSINQAVKAIIYAREYVSTDGFDVHFRAQINRDVETNAVELEIIKVVPKGPVDAEHTMKIKSDTNPFQVAGAVAGRLRDNATVALVGIGADAVRSMVKCVSAVRDYVAENGIDITARPSFEKALIDGSEMQLVRIDFFPEPRIGGAAPPTRA